MRIILNNLIDATKLRMFLASGYFIPWRDKSPIEKNAVNRQSPYPPCVHGNANKTTFERDSILEALLLNRTRRKDVLDGLIGTFQILLDRNRVLDLEEDHRRGNQKRTHE